MTRQDLIDLLDEWTTGLYEDLMKEEDYELTIYNDKRQFIPDFIGGYFEHLENSL